MKIRSLLLALTASVILLSCPQPADNSGSGQVSFVFRPGPNGSISVDPPAPGPGDTVTLIVSPDPGYKYAEGSLNLGGAQLDMSTMQMKLPAGGGEVTASAEFTGPFTPPAPMTYTVVGVSLARASFDMAAITWPSADTGKGKGIVFPVTTNDELRYNSNFDTIKSSYLMGTTEVTYQLWKVVYDWATNSARGANLYTFADTYDDDLADPASILGQPGKAGSAAGTDVTQPVTWITWYDAVIFCNALTELYNAQIPPPATPLTPVYYFDEACTTVARNSTRARFPIKSSRPESNEAARTVFVKTTAADGPAVDGFRLPTALEWEYAARWQGVLPLFPNAKSGSVDQGVPNQYFTPGKYPAGASAPYTDRKSASAVAVYSASETALTGSKAPTSQGLYDMSGNVWEWCFDDSGAEHVMRGGSYQDSAGYIAIGNFSKFPRPAKDEYVYGMDHDVSVLQDLTGKTVAEINALLVYTTNDPRIDNTNDAYDAYYAARFDPRLDAVSPNPSYPDAFAAGYNADTGRTGPSIGLRIVRSPTPP